MKTAIRTLLADLKTADDSAHLDALCDAFEIAAVQAQLDTAVSLVAVHDMCTEISDDDIIAVEGYCAAQGITFTAEELAWFRSPIKAGR